MQASGTQTSAPCVRTAHHERPATPTTATSAVAAAARSSGRARRPRSQSRVRFGLPARSRPPASARSGECYPAGIWHGGRGKLQQQRRRGGDPHLQSASRSAYPEGDGDRGVRLQRAAHRLPAAARLQVGRVAQLLALLAPRAASLCCCCCCHRARAPPARTGARSRRALARRAPFCSPCQGGIRRAGACIWSFQAHISGTVSPFKAVWCVPSPRFYCFPLLTVNTNFEFRPPSVECIFMPTSQTRKHPKRVGLHRYSALEGQFGLGFSYHERCSFPPLPLATLLYFTRSSSLSPTES